MNAAVKRLREALGDSAASPRFIETLPRRGYRFIAPVDVSDTGGSVGDAPPVSTATPTAEPHLEVRDPRDGVPRWLLRLSTTAVLILACVIAGL